MGKVPKLKNKAPSLKSRAARRAGTPPIDAGDGWKTSGKDSNIEGVLAAQNSGMITKKKKQKPLSRQQRLRKEKGLARAELVMDRTETKVDKSKNKGRNVQARRVNWDELNGNQLPHKKGTLAEQSTQGSDDLEQDATMDAEPQSEPITASDSTAGQMDGDGIS